MHVFEFMMNMTSKTTNAAKAKIVTRLNTIEQVDERTVVVRQTKTNRIDSIISQVFRASSTSDKNDNPIGKKNKKCPYSTENICIPKVSKYITDFCRKDELKLQSI